MIEKDNILKIINKLKKLERFVIEYAQENNYDNVSIGIFSREEFENFITYISKVNGLVEKLSKYITFDVLEDNMLNIRTTSIYAILTDRSKYKKLMTQIEDTYKKHLENDYYA